MGVWCRIGGRNGFANKLLVSGFSSLLFGTSWAIFWRCSREVAFARIGFGHCILRHETHFRHSWRSGFRRDFCAKLALELQTVFERKINRKSVRKRFRTRFSTQACLREGPEATFERFGSSCDAFSSLPGGLLALLGRSWAPPGRSRAALRALLRPLEARLEALFGGLGRHSGPRGLLGRPGDRFGVDFGSCQAVTLCSSGSSSCVQCVWSHSWGVFGPA